MIMEKDTEPHWEHGDLEQGESLSEDHTCTERIFLRLRGKGKQKLIYNSEEIAFFTHLCKLVFITTEEIIAKNSKDNYCRIKK